MLKWTASTQRLHEMNPAASAQPRRKRRERRATIANKENVPAVGYTSTPMPLARLRNSPLVLAPLSDIRNVTPEQQRQQQPALRVVQSVRYAAPTLPRYEEEYSPSSLPSGQHLALRGLLPLDPFLEQPRYIQRKLEPDFLATMEEQPLQQQLREQITAAKPTPTPTPTPIAAKSRPARPVTPQPASTHMGDQTLDRLIDAILDSACKADASSRKKPRKSFNLRRRTLVKQQLESQQQCEAMLSPSYAAGDDPASDLSFGLLPLPALTPEPASPLVAPPQSVLRQLPTPQGHSDTFCLETPVRPLKRSRRRSCSREQQAAAVAASAELVESPLKRYKVDARNYFEVGLALPSIYV
ncbi:hypothetical protein KR222_009043 [Zaprionus bogoriensis]|nr:hypothetical protein KR222_009043 [Zaprionus bogoriensis]